MTFIEHLLENGLHAVDKAVKDEKDCYTVFMEEMNKHYNRQMFREVNILVGELWQIVQYIKFSREV